MQKQDAQDASSAPSNNQSSSARSSSPESESKFDFLGAMSKQPENTQPSSSNQRSSTISSSSSFGFSPATSGYSQGASFQMKAPPPSTRPAPSYQHQSQQQNAQNTQNIENAQDATTLQESTSPHTPSASPPSSEYDFFAAMNQAPQESEEQQNAQPSSSSAQPTSLSAYYAEMEQKLQAAGPPPDFNLPLSDDDSDLNDGLDYEQPQTQPAVASTSNYAGPLETVQEEALEEGEIPSNVRGHGSPVRDDDDAYPDIDYRNPDSPDGSEYTPVGFYYDTQGGDTGTSDGYYYGNSSICSTNASNVFGSSGFGNSTNSHDTTFASNTSPGFERPSSALSYKTSGDVTMDDMVISLVHDDQGSPPSSSDVSMTDVVEEARAELEAELEVFWATPSIVWFAAWLLPAFHAPPDMKVAALRGSFQTLQGIEDTLSWMAVNEEMAGNPEKGARYRQKHEEMMEMRLGVLDGRIVDIPVFEEPTGFAPVMTWLEYLQATIYRPMEWMPEGPVDLTVLFRRSVSPGRKSPGQFSNWQVRFSPSASPDVQMSDLLSSQPQYAQPGKRTRSFRSGQRSASPGIQPSQSAATVSEARRRQQQKALSQPRKGHTQRSQAPRKGAQTKPKRQGAKRKFRATDGQVIRPAPAQRPLVDGSAALDPTLPHLNSGPVPDFSKMAAAAGPETRRPTTTGVRRTSRHSSSYRDDPLSNGRPKDHRRRDRY